MDALIKRAESWIEDFKDHQPDMDYLALGLIQDMLKALKSAQADDVTTEDQLTEIIDEWFSFDERSGSRDLARHILSHALPATPPSNPIAKDTTA